QAEDGIRDRTVTGVQTCALPILVGDCKYKRLEIDEFKNHDLYQVLAYCTALRVDRGLLVYPRHSVAIAYDLPVLGSKVVIRQARSEERRVGRECEVEGGSGRRIE